MNRRWKYRFLEIYPWIVCNFSFVISIIQLSKTSITLKHLTFAKIRKLPKCRRVGWVLVKSQSNSKKEVLYECVFTQSMCLSKSMLCMFHKSINKKPHKIKINKQKLESTQKKNNKILIILIQSWDILKIGSCLLKRKTFQLRCALPVALLLWHNHK